MPNNAKNPTLDEVIGRNVRRLRGFDSQDTVARKARAIGLKWSRSTITALEQGTKTLDVAELVLLSCALGEPITELLAGDDLVELAPSFALSGSEILGVLGSDLDRLQTSLSAGSASARTILSDPVAFRSRLAAATEQFNRYARIIPRITNTQLDDAGNAARGEAEVKAARKLQIEDPVEVAVAAIARWGRSLTDERDARVLAAAPPGAQQRTLQALRGHVTRQLLEELEPTARKADR